MSTEAAMNEKKVQEQWDAQRRKVDVDQSDVSTRELIRMVLDEELVISPEYQRKFRWSLDARSRLVESILLGLPIPNLFVATNPDGTWETVDGLQRVSTLLHFAGESSKAYEVVGEQSPLRLQGLESLSELNGAAFSDLPHPLQLAFYKRALRVVAISDKSDMTVRFDMFERLNTGGVALTAQEIRACIYRGPFNELLRELAEDHGFLKLVKLQSSHKDDGTKEELVLKFFAYMNARDSFDGGVKAFLSGYMKSAPQTLELAAAKTLFTSVCSSLHEITKGPVLRKGYGVTPLNQLEAILVAAGELVGAGKKLKQPPKNWLNDSELVKFSTKGTNTPTALEGRIRRAKELLLGKVK